VLNDGADGEEYPCYKMFNESNTSWDNWTAIMHLEILYDIYRESAGLNGRAV
jgi:hypothetical protein